MDAVIRPWVTVVEVEEGELEGFGRVFQQLLALLYVDYGLLVSPWPTRLQEALDVLTGLFDRFGLRTNVAKIVGLT